MTSGPPLILEELMIREILQFLCALKVDSCGDNAKTINLSVTNNLLYHRANGKRVSKRKHPTHDISRNDSRG